jgi:hypothetical protein
MSVEMASIGIQANAGSIGGHLNCDERMSNLYLELRANPHGPATLVSAVVGSGDP